MILFTGILHFINIILHFINPYFLITTAVSTEMNFTFSPSYLDRIESLILFT